MEPVPATPESPTPAQSTQAKPVPVDRQRKWRLYIAGTISAGLLVAVGYLGARIFIGPPQSKAAEAPIAAQSQAPIAAEVQKPSPAPVKIAVPAKPEASASAPKPEPPKPVAVAKVATPVETAPPVETPAASEATLPAPKRRGNYLQIGAINSPSVANYVSELRRDQWEPIVVEGPRSGVERVLVGPFPDNSSLEAAKARLQALGIDYFVRIY